MSNALRDTIARWKVEVDDSAFNRLNKRIELANRALEKLDKTQKQRLRADRVGFQVEEMKLRFLQQQTRELAKQQAIRRQQNLADMATQKRMKAQNRARSGAAASQLFWGAGMALGAVGAAGWKAVQKASDARESENLLNVVFGNQANEMKQWAEQTGNAMQRSKYQLQDYAGRFGAFLTPMTKGQDTSAFGGVAGMSQQASQLVVDLASFYNISEDEARQRVYSGLAGETEAVRKLGADLSDASLESLNKQNGSKVAYNQLSMGEKTILRFQKLMMDTELAQGDAIRTANDFSNVLKRVVSRFNELLVEVGKGLIPLAKDIASWLDGTLFPVMKEFGQNTHALRTGFEFLAVQVAGAAGAFLILNPSVLAFAGIFGALYLVFDEFRSILMGADTYLGNFLEWIDWTGRTGRQVWDGITMGIIGFGDILFGVGMDLATFFPKVLMGIYDMIFNGLSWDEFKKKLSPGETYTAKAMARTKAAVSGADAEAQQRRQGLIASALQGNTEAFGTQAGEFFRSDTDATNSYNALRRQAIERGQIAATAQDVANGSASQDMVDAGQLALAEGMANNAVVYSDININVAGTNATPKQLEEAVAEGLRSVLRQAAAASGEETEQE